MRSHDLTPGRTIGVVFDHGDDFFTALADACRAHGVKQGYIPMFIAGLSTAKIVGTCQRLDNPDAPVWSHAELTNVEALGGGTIAWDNTTQTIVPHIHLTVGLEERSTTAHPAIYSTRSSTSSLKWSSSRSVRREYAAYRTRPFSAYRSYTSADQTRATSRGGR